MNWRSRSLCGTIEREDSTEMFLQNIEKAPEIYYIQGGYVPSIFRAGLALLTTFLASVIKPLWLQTKEGTKPSPLSFDRNIYLVHSFRRKRKSIRILVALYCTHFQAPILQPVFACFSNLVADGWCPAVTIRARSMDYNHFSKSSHYRFSDVIQKLPTPMRWRMWQFHLFSNWMWSDL